MSKYTFGADPEMFIIDGSSSTVVPAYLLFPDTGKGKCLDIGAAYGGIHADNVMLEFNPPPRNTMWELMRSVASAKITAQKVVYTKLVKAPIKGIRAGDTYIHATSAHNIDSVNRKELYLNNSRFFEFGCEPDFNAYTRAVNPSPTLPENLRVAGGHLMISAMDERLKDPEIVFSAVRWMDVFVAPLLSLAQERYLGTPVDEVVRRRQYYGKPGCFRPKEFPNGAFGIEYRTPGPEWTMLGEITKAHDIVNEIGTAMIRSVEYALEFKPYNIAPALIDAAITHENAEARLELLEMAAYV